MKIREGLRLIDPTILLWLGLPGEKRKNKATKVDNRDLLLELIHFPPRISPTVYAT